MKRTTISVPDKLYAKMDKWRRSINFSKEFQKHISRVIQRKEDLKERLKGDDEMQEIIERLRDEKTEALGDFSEMGFEAGLMWAKEAHYIEIQDALEWDIDEKQRNVKSFG